MIPSLLFSLRQSALGKLQFHNTLPTLPDFARRGREPEFYPLAIARAFSKTEAENIRLVVDVGCSNWSYVRALANSFPNAALLGVELDGGRRYWNLHRRIDYAQAYADEVRKEGRWVEVYWRDFLQLVTLTHVKIPAKSEVLFCFFFPFVSENPCLKWGLPRRYVNFEALLKKVHLLCESAALQSRILSVHQGEWEAHEAERSYSNLKLAVKQFSLDVEETTEVWPSHFETRGFLL